MATPARRRFLEFMVATAALHVAMIGLYYGVRVGAWSTMAQRYFAWTWMAATVAVVFWGLRRIRAQRGRRPAP